MKVYVIVIKGTGVLTSRYECYDSLEKAKGSLTKSRPDNCELRSTDLRNEFEVWKNGSYLHTLQIVDLWVH
jgi:hypothetical protein